MPGVVIRAILVTLSATSWAKPASSPESDLLDSLFSDYNPIARPVLRLNDTVDVGVEFAYIGIVGLDETEQTITCHGMIKIEWTDPFLSWNDTQFSEIDAIYVPPDKIWTPDIVLANSVGSTLDPIHTVGTKVKVKQTGQVVWMPSGMFKYYCNLDITLFPFDKQSCYLAISTNAHDTKFVRLNIKSDGRQTFNGVDAMINDNSQWEVLGENSSVYETEHSCRDFLIFSIHIKRRSHYFVMNVLFPSFILAILNIFVLLIPEELSDKLAVCTTLVLAYVIFLIQITDSTPTNSENLPFVTVILLVMMSLSSLDVIIAVTFLRFASCTTDKPPPVWLWCIMGKRKLVRHLNASPGSPHIVGKIPSSAFQTGGEHNGQCCDQIKDDEKELWRNQWQAVFHRLNWIVVICQLVIVLVMYTSIPSVYISQM